MAIIPQNKSIIVACDVPYKEFTSLITETADMGIVGGYKLGTSFLDVGLKTAVGTVRQYTQKPIIYDHQKAGNDIPQHVPQQFMDALLRAGVDAVILFPFAGPVTQYEWTKAAQERNLGVMVGGEMTHQRFKDGDFKNPRNPAGRNYSDIFLDLGLHRDLSGYLRKSAPIDIYELAAKMGVTDFVLPGTKTFLFKEYAAWINRWTKGEAVFYSPGFITQEGSLSKAAQNAGEKFHPIVGRAITEAKDKKEAITSLERILGR